mgnify:CR=1 FL=1
MGNLTYLFSQHGRHYFRRRIPKDLGAIIRKSEIKISLGAGTFLADAKRYAIHLSAIYQDYFSRLRQSGNNIAEETDHLNLRIQKFLNDQPDQHFVDPVGAKCAKMRPLSPTSLPTLTGFLPIFVKEKSRGWGESAKRHNLNAIDLFIKITGDKNLGDYTRHDILNYMGTLERVHKSCGKSDKDKDRTIDEILAVGAEKEKMSI